ncbi:MAG: hypothetical protein UU00_C0008G0003 [Microgenomates group bacterium GW2011_GWC1_40_35]|nr:MAG: hypothetical protein UU00_C0008G0003 [Microgenomates group bacterium GW2011_GWC1_40_35]
MRTEAFILRTLLRLDFTRLGEFIFSINDMRQDLLRQKRQRSLIFSDQRRRVEDSNLCRPYDPRFSKPLRLSTPATLQLTLNLATGAPKGTRTPNRNLRKVVLYPIELWALIVMQLYQESTVHLKFEIGNSSQSLSAFEEYGPTYQKGCAPGRYDSAGVSQLNPRASFRKLLLKE